MFVYFKGDIQENKDRKEVKSGLAALFSVPEASIDPLFNNEAVFLRSGLDHFAALKMVEAFTKAGGRPYLGEESIFADGTPDPNQVFSLESAECIQCGVEQTDGGDRCLLCGGHLLKKSIKKESPGASVQDDSAPDQKLPANESEPPPDRHSRKYDEDLRRSDRIVRRVFRFGSLMMLILFIFDEELYQYSLRFAGYYNESNTPTLGIMPFAIITGYITYGCLHYARIKGYSKWFGLLGMANLFGIGCMVLLPNKFNPSGSKKLLTKKNLQGVIIVLIAMYTLPGMLLKRVDMEELAGEDVMRFLDRPIPFGAELEVRDDDSRHSWSTTCEKGAPVLKAYIDEALELLADHDYSISLTEKIADRYYHALSNFSIWLTYQHYLFLKNQEEIPNELRIKAIALKVKEYYDAIEAKIDEIHNPVIYRTRNDWTSGYYRQKDPEAKQIEKLGRWLAHWMSNLGDRGPYIDLKQYVANFDPAPYMFLGDLRLEDGELVLQFKEGLPEYYAGKTLRFGIWFEEGTRYDQYVFRRIGGTVSGRYIDLQPSSILTCLHFGIEYCR